MGSVSGKGNRVFSFFRGNSSERNSKRPELLAREKAQTEQEGISSSTFHVAGMSQEKIQEYANVLAHPLQQRHFPSKEDINNRIPEAWAFREFRAGGDGTTVREELHSDSKPNGMSVLESLEKTKTDLFTQNPNPSPEGGRLLKARVDNIEKIEEMFQEKLRH